MNRLFTAVAVAGAVFVGVAATGMSLGHAAPVKGVTGDGADTLGAVALLGRQMFFDTALSGSGKLACSSCHDPANHYGPSGKSPVFIGGAHLDRAGTRTIPSLTYMNLTPPFSIGPEPAGEIEGPATVVAAPTDKPATPLVGPLSGTPTAGGKANSNAADQVPQGGFFWDGRADTLQEQPAGPLLAPNEMANATKADFLTRLKARPYAKTFEQLFGSNVFKDPGRAFAEAEFAFARYEFEDTSFHPFTSKYDAYLRGKVKLSPQEARGLKLFDDEKKGDCAACHLDTMGKDGTMPVFTDYEYEALGLPRNPKIPANADPAYYDLGICGPSRHDAYAQQVANCGLFKTPTLRNVATRPVFFHNGIYDNLTDVVRFYMDRETRPEKIYPKGPDGKLALYNDLPRKYWPNLDRIDPPLNAKRSDKPALNDAEIADVVAFLKTLTDGYTPPASVLASASAADAGK
ncbi:c-type cytochrome [Jiella sp. MQZ9-1]|uniref:C-type cytochrome n=1 Tax=Jiella flava TaxID=2816857 RepID=A0A939FXT2_9HYPH|nr:cytochrome c peroxidase [Jiella flava]MBO0663480.1 c-type cytochrome [Jiella flava]MCD2472055.1 c-type cytochrome [Jiella flava]